MNPVLVTTVIPAYNEGDRLFTFLEEWASIGPSHVRVRATAIVVDDGSREDESDRQRQAVDAAAAALRRAGAHHRVAYQRAPRNRGKGASIRWGWSVADAESAWLSFIDADGAVPAREYWRLADQLPAATADALCGSRVNMAGRSVQRSLFRHLQGRSFATLVDELLHIGLYDTQCGLKFFRASVLRPLLPELREDRWLLDVELLALLKASRARLEEVPIDCHERGGSSLVFGVDAVKMTLQLVRLRRRLGRRRGASA